MKEGTYVVVHKYLVHRLATPSGPLAFPFVGRARLVVPAPFNQVRRVGPAADIIVRSAGHVMGKDKLVPRIASFEGCPQPVELSLAQRPIPTVTRTFVFLTAARGTDERLGGGEPIGIDDYKECIAPGPGVIILAQLVAIQFRHGFRVACVKTVWRRVDVVLLLRIGRKHRRTACIVEMPALLLFVVACSKEDWRRMAHKIKELALIQVGRIRPAGCCDRIHGKGIAQVNFKIWRRSGDIGHGLRPGGGVAQHDIDMRIGSDGEGKLASCGSLRPERMLGAVHPVIRWIARGVVLHPVVIPGIRSQPRQEYLTGLSARNSYITCLSSIRPGRNAVLIVIFDRCIGNNVDGDRTGGGTPQKLCAAKGDHISGLNICCGHPKRAQQHTQDDKERNQASLKWVVHVPSVQDQKQCFSLTGHFSENGRLDATTQHGGRPG